MVNARGMGCQRLRFRVDRLTACMVGPEVAVFGHLRPRAAPMHALSQLANTNRRKKATQMAKHSMITRVFRPTAIAHGHVSAQSVAWRSLFFAMSYGSLSRC